MAKQPARRFIALGTGRSYRSHPLREVPTVSPKATAHPYEDDDRRREAELVATGTDPRDEPECVGPAILASYAEVNKRIFDQQHALDVAVAQQTRPLLALEDRIKDIRRRAKFAHVDLSRETHLMQRDIDRAKAGNRKPPKRVEERCEGLEALLDGIAA